MRVVIIDGDVSYPATSGKRLRTLNLMLQLADRHQLTYLARRCDSTTDTRTAREFLQDHGIEVQIVDDPLPRKAGVAFYARLAGNLASPLPYSVATHQSQRMRQAVNQLASQDHVDLWQCEWTGYLSTLIDQPRSQRLLMAHNVDSLIWQRYHAAEKNWARRWYVREQWRKFEAFEQQAFRQAGQIVAVSDDDAERMKHHFGLKHVEVVDNGVDCEWLQGVQRATKRHQWLFLGGLDWRPNQDAVRFLLDDIVPRVNQRINGARLLIVGRRPPGWLVERVRRTAGVELMADVPDVRPYLAESSVMIVPLRIGGGSRLKILEALATGLPVVSTTIGAEGLRLDAGQHFIEANTADELADATGKCLTQPDWAQAVASEGRQLVQQEYDWPILAERLHDIWTSVGDTACAGR